MEIAIPKGNKMGPERIFPNSNDDLGEQRAPEGLQENMGDWSGEEEEELPHEEEDDENEGGYFYQPLNQDPEHGGFVQHSHPEQDAGGDYGHPEGGQNALELEEDIGTNIQERLQEMRLHLPDPPVDSDDDDILGATANNSQTSIPMDAAHVELVKKTMAGIKLTSLGVPPWAKQISDEQWKDMVQVTLQSRTSDAGHDAAWQ
ncbi:male-enhanced antigen 1 [Ambystoma mexicanum]|uniref:male-enhanced antigen 1 n=1 Tax=Ambystoma mexicanum TaxID=8296 RepID=UPI0037E89410